MVSDDAQAFVVALDVGGSLTKVACADAGGALATPRRIVTPRELGPAGLVRWVADQVLAAAESSAGECVGFAVAVPGVIDSGTGRVLAATNLGWRDVPLRDRLVELTDLPGVVAHDVRTAGLAEWRLGAGRGLDNLLFLPLGTGIAGAMVVDGRLLEADGYAGEIGHLRVRAAGDRSCACGQRGCLETVASAGGVVRSYADTAELTPGSPSVPAVAQHVANLARAGNPAALAAFDRAADALSEALLISVTLLGPELVIIGGGLADAADLFVPQLNQSLEASMTFQRLPRIVTAAFGPDAGVIGAGLVGWEHLRRQRLTTS